MTPPLGMKGHPPGKDSQPAELTAEDVENTGWIMKNAVINKNHDYVISHRNDDCTGKSISYLFCYEHACVYTVYAAAKFLIQSTWSFYFC